MPLELVADRDRIVTIATFARGAPAAGIELIGGGPDADPGTELRDRARRGPSQGQRGHVSGKLALVPRPWVRLASGATS